MITCQLIGFLDDGVCVVQHDDLVAADSTNARFQLPRRQTSHRVVLQHVNRTVKSFNQLVNKNTMSLYVTLHTRTQDCFKAQFNGTAQKLSRCHTKTCKPISTKTTAMQYQNK